LRIDIKKIQAIDTDAIFVIKKIMKDKLPKKTHTAFIEGDTLRVVINPADTFNNIETYTNIKNVKYIIFESDDESDIEKLLELEADINNYNSVDYFTHIIVLLIILLIIYVFIKYITYKPV
jgi:hypothetical protein